ncbi:MAG: HAD hydrolase-like protein, partial [Oscillospiraceae bacterium]|nr:HAD hydrolase-like protein [Oscillospiraceae bacterium]
MIKTILWDVDGTLLDFLAAEREAIRTLFRRFDIGECSDEMLQKYSAINKAYWERLERGEMTKSQILVGRFHDFFKSEGIDTSLAPEFNEAYQLSLGDTIVYRDNSLDIIKSLCGKVKQYVVSNGTIVAQTKKLRLSGL